MSPCRSFHSPLTPAQALDTLDPCSAAARKCLRELRSICGTKAILPTSYTLSSDRLNIGPEPFASGGYGDVYNGTLDGSRVCIKRVRVYTEDGPEKAAKVRYCRRRFPSPQSLMKLLDLLPRGRNLEAPETPKHRILTGCHYHPLPTHFRLDVWRRPTEIHQRKPECRPL